MKAAYSKPVIFSAEYYSRLQAYIFFPTLSTSREGDKPL